MSEGLNYIGITVDPKAKCLINHLNHNDMRKHVTKPGTCIVICLLTLLALKGSAQNEKPSFPKDTLMAAAREIIKSTPFCALATVDLAGQPQVRTMNPFPVEDDMVIWFATGRESRKVSEIKSNPKVSVYFADHVNARGDVNTTGTAEIIDGNDLLEKMKRGYWENITNWQEIFVLVKITPKTLDVISYAHGISGDPKTSRASTIIF
jgi:general stress protein 26